MQITALTITHNRPEFIPWLLWVFDSQRHTDKRLIIVDSSDDPLVVDRADVEVIRTANNNVAYKRNLALDAATGTEAVAWFDDDDWSHPDRLSLLAGRLENAAWAGTQWGWFVDLKTRAVRRYANRKTPTFNSGLFRYDAVSGVRFDENITRGSDIAWLENVANMPFVGGYDPLQFWLCHNRNLGNTAVVHYFNRDFSDIMDMVGRADLTTTRSQLTALRERVY
jgi:glycosyltransferase involved in cell wall biosynthesis